MTLEDEVLFQRFNISGYSTDAPYGVSDAAASANDNDASSDDSQRLLGDTQGHSDD